MQKVPQYGVQASKPTPEPAWLLTAREWFHRWFDATGYITLDCRDNNCAACVVCDHECHQTEHLNHAVPDLINGETK